MAVNKAAAYGMYSHNISPNDVVCALNQAGFKKEDICMMLSPTHPIAAIVRETGFPNQDREASAVAAELIGWLSEFGAVVIPTVGFFLRSQVFFHAVMVANESSSVYGSASTLTGLGLSNADAERHGSQLRHLGVMLYVSCPERTRTGWAMELLRRAGAKEAATLEQETAMETIA